MKWENWGGALWMAVILAGMSAPTLTRAHQAAGGESPAPAVERRVQVAAPAAPAVRLAVTAQR